MFHNTWKHNCFAQKNMPSAIKQNKPLTFVTSDKNPSSSTDFRACRFACAHHQKWCPCPGNPSPGNPQTYLAIDRATRQMHHDTLLMATRNPAVTS